MKIQAQWLSQLPESKHPWEIRNIGGQVIAVNPEHEPRLIEDGKVSIIKLKAVTT